MKATADKGWKLKANDEADSDSEKIAAGDTVTVKQGKNIRVKRSGKELTIETADDVAFNKVTVGNSVLTTDGLPHRKLPRVTAYWQQRTDDCQRYGRLTGIADQRRTEQRRQQSYRRSQRYGGYRRSERQPAEPSSQSVEHQH